MDSYQVSLSKLVHRRTALAGAAVLATAALAPLGGCARKASQESGSLAGRLRRKLDERKNETPPLSIQMSGNSFQIDDAKGLRLLDAKVEKMDGNVTTGKGIDGPVRFKVAKCRLYKDGKPQLNLDAPEAVWDGRQLIAEKAVHAVTVEGDRIMDATRSTWTAENGHLDLENAKIRTLKGKKLQFTAGGPRALVVDKVVTLPAGVLAESPKGERMTAQHARWFMGARRLEASRGVILTGTQGQQLTANRLTWALETGKLEANGNVVITEEGTRVTGQRLVGNTELKKGRLSGGTRVEIKKIQIARKNG